MSCVEAGFVHYRGRSHMMHSFTATDIEIPEVDEVHNCFISFAVHRNTQQETIAEHDKSKICMFSCMIRYNILHLNAFHAFMTVVLFWWRELLEKCGCRTVLTPGAASLSKPAPSVSILVSVSDFFLSIAAASGVAEKNRKPDIISGSEAKLADPSTNGTLHFPSSFFFT